MKLNRYFVIIKDVEANLVVVRCNYLETCRVVTLLRKLGISDSVFVNDQTIMPFILKFLEF